MDKNFQPIRRNATFKIKLYKNEQKQQVQSKRLIFKA